MRWKTTLLLLIAAVAIGTYVSLYEIRQPSPEERQRHSKDILSIRPESVTQLVLDMPQAKSTLTREGPMWKLAPQGVRADPELVQQLLEALSSLTAERILSGSPEHPLDPKTYGLEPAVGQLSLEMNGTPVTLFIGETTPVHGNRYLKLSNRPEIFVVSSQLLDAANVPTETFRDPALIRFNGWLIDELQMTSPTVSWDLARRENRWSLTQPLADYADRTEVNVLLNWLTEIRIKRFVHDTPNVEQLSTWGFDDPKAEVTLRQTESPTSVTLFFGNAVGDDASLVYAKRSDEPALYAVAREEVEPFLKDPNDLRAKRCFEFLPSNVTKVEVTHAGTHWTIERNDAQWQEQGSGVALETQRVEELLDTLADLHVTGFPTDVPKDTTGRDELGPEAGMIAVWTSGTDRPQRLVVFGLVNSSIEHYGVIEGRAAIVALPASITNLLATTIDQLKAPSGSPSVH